MVEEPAGGVYPEYWEADVVLRDGGTAHLRPIHPTDVDAVQAFHTGQSQNSIYMRFFAFKARLSSRELKRFTEVDFHDRVAFVITIGGEIIGIGRYDRLDDPTEAEVAFNIADAHQGRGIGSILLEHLAAAAREKGIRRFTAEVLPENRKMLGVFSDAGYDVSRHFDDGVVSLEFNIDPTEKSRAVMESREHRAEARSVRELLAPSSVAVIGASRTWGKLGYQLLEHLIEGGYKGPVYAVNPEALELAGMLSFSKLSEIPDPVQLAIIAVPYEEVPAVVDDCAAAGVKGLLIATSGFADDGERGLQRQRALVRKARAYGMRVIGPASLGVINTHPDVLLNASMAPHLPKRGSLGLFSQSAAIGVSLYAACSRRRVGLSTFLSAGNRADVSGNDLMQYWEDDADTGAVGLYLESIGNPRKFSRLARRLARTKPVIVAKSDTMGLQLPRGHAVRTTQAPAGALDAMLRQSGVIRVETIEALMDVSQIVTASPLPAGPRVAVVSNSYALGMVVADNAAANGLVVDRTLTELDLDAGMSVALPALRELLAATLAAESVDSVVVTLLPARGLTVENIATVLAECSVEAAKPVIAIFTGIMDPSVYVEGMAGGTDAAGSISGIPCYANPGAAVAALSAVAWYSQWARQDRGAYVEPEGCDAEAVHAELEVLLKDVRGEQLKALDAATTSALLGHYGISVLPSAQFETDDEAVAAADRLGWPVVLKTTDPALRHRLDLGGVRLDIQDGDSLRRNLAQMRRALAGYGSAALEVQSMAPVGQACIMRAIEDPLLGPVVSFGLAGDAVNLLDDWAHRVPPLAADDVKDFIRSPRASRKLFSYQGLPPADVGALEDLAARLSLLKDNHPEIALVEFNPVLCGRDGLAILAADVRIANPAQRTDSARRAMLG
ncbi:GNAT family N-acetyltransferase [Pseudarthrobacter sp. J75]|uniref:bifunctional acetate--CoA ligase family protein/GNAT family N-acetyltransferase n=1 Tax=unclassified Pseudarthrobacter TaxID=2647000 RepID=UPI002E81C13A|nr:MULTISPECIES: GNAT family N-acetyltransferase [unclassified Pseudarthrobacter]MEE2522711.1 GNAT family N-acetyltransferase [Pseudarthrobacter sp. J47]MEE2529572.1 GNAT family N-acetyltransferase [Pseudarthrobacter sp. J75]MEE2569660.1 GNAT family N-acetyltransferase [Pseudarthrobacter sp. J64]